MRSQPRFSRYYPPCVRLGLLTLVALLLASCMTESARLTATSEAGGTPQPTPAPAGTVLFIDDKPVLQVFVPDPEQQALYALTAEQLYAWHNREWQATGTPNDGRQFLVDHNNQDRLFRGNHGICAQEQSNAPIPFEMSEDAGKTWKVLPNGRNVRPLAIDPLFPDVIYGTDCSLRISTNMGGTWRYLQPLFRHEIVDLVVVGERVLVLGISTQGKSQVRELRLATPDDPQISDIIIQVEGIAAIDADTERVAVGGPEGVRVSLDGGQTWSQSRVGLESVTIDPDDTHTPDPSVQRPNQQFGVVTLEIDPTNSHRIFAGTVRGLYISQDDGGTWDLYSEIDPTARVSDIQLAYGGADLYVTTDSGVIVVPNP